MINIHDSAMINEFIEKYEIDLDGFKSMATQDFASYMIKLCDSHRALEGTNIGVRDYVCAKILYHATHGTLGDSTVLPEDYTDKMWDKGAAMLHEFWARTYQKKTAEKWLSGYINIGNGYTKEFAEGFCSLLDGIIPEIEKVEIISGAVD